MNRKKETRIKFIKNAKNKGILIKILSIIIFFCILANIIFLINSTIKKIDYFNLFKISLLSMDNNLMGDEIPQNALVITKEYEKFSDIDIDDNIAYYINGKIRINKVVGKEIVDGEEIYRTKSNNNYLMDKEEISKNAVIGKVVAVIPFLGIIFKILQSKIITILIIFFLIMKYKHNKNEYRRRVMKNKTLRKNP